MAALQVIDSHFHWFPRALFERLCDQPGYPRAERTEDGYRYFYDHGKASAKMSPVWLDLDRGLEESDSVTGEGTVVIGTTGVLAGLLEQLPREVAKELALEYNEEVAAAQRRHPGRFYGTGYVPLLDTADALEVTEHAVKHLGLVGVNLPSIAGDRLADEPELDAFYARVAELGVPLLVHPTDYVYEGQFGGYDHAIFLTVGRLLDSSISVLRLVFSGVLERHRDLKVVHTHAGGLLPYQAGRIDKNVYRSAEITGLPGTPSEYLKRIYVDTAAPQALTIRTALEFYGSDRVLYGTDYPCWSPAKALGVIDEAKLETPAREGILRHNAARVFPIV